jgi:anti-sigma B factor antagonist
VGVPHVSYMLTERPISPDTHVVAVAGELDLGAAPDLEAIAGRLIDGGVRTLIVDLSEATFIDSAGIGVLVGNMRRLRDVGGALEIVCSEPNLLRIFEIVGLDRQLTIRGG